RACGLKPLAGHDVGDVELVTPLAGVWIETPAGCCAAAAAGWSRPSRACGLKQFSSGSIVDARRSRPSRACGLKLLDERDALVADVVTPLAGVWIETLVEADASLGRMVTPLAGVWIETSM